MTKQNGSKGEVPAETIKASKGKDKGAAGRNWKAEGQTVAKQFIDLETSADATRWNVLMQEAEALANNKPSIDSFLEGFGQVYIEKYGKDTAKARKSEVKAIIEACYIDKAKLEACVGGWHKRVELARQIRPSKGTGKGETVKVKLTAKQADSAIAHAKEADASQATSIAYAALTRIGSLPNTGLLLVNTGIATINRIKSDDKVIQGYCNQVLELLDKIAAAFKAEGEKVEEGKNMAEEQSAAGNKMLKAA